MKAEPQLRIRTQPVGSVMTRERAAETLWLARRHIKRTNNKQGRVYRISDALEININ